MPIETNRVSNFAMVPISQTQWAGEIRSLNSKTLRQALAALREKSRGARGFVKTSLSSG